MLGMRPIRNSSSTTPARKPRRPVRRVAKILVLMGAAGFAANVLAAAVLQLEHGIGSSPANDSRAALPNYRGVDWADTHFREFGELETVHHSYVGWRRLPYRGETITIDDHGVRATYQPPQTQPGKVIAFFGGSTMWGSGSDDERTIPSAFAKNHRDYRALNFSETAHTAHQNVNGLIQVLAGGLEPDVVVFYNGSSEINKCRVGVTAFSTTDEPEIRELLDRQRRGLQRGEAFRSVFQPVRALADRMVDSFRARLFGSVTGHDCLSDPAKAELIARTMLWDWLAAKRLVEGYGGRFVAALQPVAYFSNTRKDHIKIDRELQGQYEAVYSMYDALLDDFPALQDNFLDLRGVFDRDEYIYIDADHAGPNGNAIVAAAIGSFLEGRAGRLSASR
jgi:hypothetical protein